MTRALLIALGLCTGCVHGTSMFRKTSTVRAEAAADSLFQAAVHYLMPSNKNRSLDSAVALLDQYLGSPAKLKHIAEASAMAALARDARQLDRVQAELQRAEARAETRGETAEKPAAESRGRDDDAVKEIARLKDELAKANQELERIKKRLAAPAPKP